MALADTAELAVRLSLDDRLSKGLGNVERRLGSLERGVSKVGRGVSATSRVMGTFGGIVLDRVVSKGIGALTNAFREGTASLEELEAVTLRTQGAIASTGGVAGQTADSIRALSERMEDLTTNDDKAVQGAANMLLTFTNVRKKAFEPALTAVLDLNAALGKGDEGLQGTAILVGKALNDPARGLTALRRVGVSFTKQQEEQIKRLVEQNKLYEAQTIILGELEKEFGGQGEIFGKGAAADARRLSDAVEDLQVVFARGLAPAVENIRKGLTKAFSSDRVITAVDTLSKKIAGFVTPANVEKGIGIITQGMEALADVDFKSIGEGLRITGQAAKVAVDAFLSLPPDIQKIAIAALAVNKLSGGVAGALAVKGIEAILGGLKTIIAGNVTVVGKNVVGAGGAGAGGAAAKGGGIAGKLGGILKVAGAVTIAGVALELLRETADNTSKQIGEAQTGLRNQVGATTNQDFKQTVDNLTSVAKSIRGMSGLDQILLDTFGNAEVFANFRDGAKRLVTASGLSEGQLKTAREAIVAARDALVDLNRTDQAAELDKSIAAIDARIASGVKSGVEPLIASNNALIDAHSTTDGIFTKAIAAFLKKRPPEAVENFRKAEQRVGKSNTFTVIAKAPGTDKSVLPVVQNLVRSLAAGNSPWARDLSVMKGHLANLKGLEERFLATGDTKSAAIIGASIQTLQGAVTAAQERETNVARLAKQAAEGTTDSVERTKGAILTAQGATTAKLDLVTTALSLVRTATLGIVPALGPKTQAIRDAVDRTRGAVAAIPPAISRNRPQVDVVVNTSTRVNVSARDVSIAQERSSRYGYNHV